MGRYKVDDVQVLTPQTRAFNKAMSQSHISVEWLFGDISNYFKFTDYKKNMKLQLSAVGKQHIVSALMRNILTLFYGNLTSDYFDFPESDSFFAVVVSAHLASASLWPLTFVVQ